MAKKNAKRLGALGLAGALALGGAVVGEGAATAALASEDSVRLIGPFVTKNAGNAPFYTNGWRTEEASPTAEMLADWKISKQMDSAAEDLAVRNAEIFSFPAPGGSGPVIDRKSVV